MVKSYDVALGVQAVQGVRACASCCSGSCVSASAPDGGEALGEVFVYAPDEPDAN